MIAGILPGGRAAVSLSDNDNLCKVGTSLSSLSAEAAAGSYLIEFQHKTMHTFSK